MDLNLKKEGTYKYDAASLGEVMLRLDPGEGRIRTARSFRAWEGGGEYNVIRGLHKCFGMNTAVITAFADNEVGKLMIDESRHQIFREGKPIALAPTEYDVLRYMMQRVGQAVSREELLNSVWGFETAVETRATDDTVRRLRQKLDGCGVKIAAVWGFGFRLEENE